jgi:hypothetical protein
MEAATLLDFLVFRNQREVAITGNRILGAGTEYQAYGQQDWSCEFHQ